MQNKSDFKGKEIKMRYYAVADTHGYYSILERALKEAGFFEDKEPSKLIVCGDLLDRGAKAKALSQSRVRSTELSSPIYIGVFSFLVSFSS